MYKNKTDHGTKSICAILKSIVHLKIHVSKLKFMEIYMHFLKADTKEKLIFNEKI